MLTTKLKVPRNLMYRTNFNMLVILLSITLTIILTPNRFEEFDLELNFLFPTIGILNVVVFWVTTSKYFKSWVRFDTLFLLGYCIVHFQIPLLASLGIEPTDQDYIWINKMVVNYATWISLLAILVWMLGFLFYCSRVRISSIIPKYKVVTRKIDLLLVFFFLSFIVLVGQDFLGGAYDGGNNWGANANYAFLMLSTTLYLRIIYFFINVADTKIGGSNLLLIVYTNFLFFAIMFIYVLVFLAAGDRGPVMQVAILFLGGYSIYQKKISMYAFFALTLFGASIFTIVSYGRSSDLSNKSANVFEQGIENFKDNDISFNPTNELAGTNRILYRAIDVVPDAHPYLNGLTMFSDVISVVPFAGSTYSEYMDLPDMYKSSAYFFTVLGQGKYFTSGEGSEIISDIYINFGITGVLLIMCVFGTLMSGLSFGSLYSRSHVTSIIFLLVLTTSIYINRSNILDPLKLVVYGLVLDYFFTKKIQLV